MGCCRIAAVRFFIIIGKSSELLYDLKIPLGRIALQRKGKRSLLICTESPVQADRISDPACVRRADAAALRGYKICPKDWCLWEFSGMGTYATADVS